MPDVATPELSAPQDASAPATLSPEAPPLVDNKKIADNFKQEIVDSKKHRRKISPHWKTSILIRLGNPGILTSGSGIYEPSGNEDRQSLINPDWSLTKTKTANLYSQVPQVQCTHENTQYAAAIPPFAKALNYELGEKRANVGPPMEEVLNDVVNAAGVGAVMVGYAARFETKQVPVEEMIPGQMGPMQTRTMPPDAIQQLAKAGVLHLKDVQQVVDDKFFVMRISPGDLLWPAEFVHSDFDQADFLGYTARAPWAVAKVEFPKLTEDQKSAACGGAEYHAQDDLRTFPDRSNQTSEEQVTYDDVYYWRYRVDPDEKSFCAIWRIVFIHGIEEAILHEPWKGQQYDPQMRTYIGSKKFPVRVLTLTYVTDHPVAISDSAAGRPQVHDLRRSRSQMFDNRDRSRPVRWYDTNRIDATIGQSLMRGTWQGFIPTNGDGTRTVGEIARASYPSEDLTFDQQTKQDLMEVWQIGPNQTSQATGVTATESENVQANFATRMGQERGRVATFFLSTAEVLAGWMVLYGRFPTLTDQERQAMEGAWDMKRISHDLVLKVRPDSTVILDSSQRIERLTKLLNITGKSGVVNIEPIVAELVELTGLDPAVIMKKLEPPPPEEPNISLRLSGKDDLINPLVMAMLVQLKKAPSIEQIQEAQKILAAAAGLSPLPQPPGAPGPVGAGAAPGPNGPVPTPGAAPPPPDWGLMDHVAKRTEDLAGA